MFFPEVVTDWVKIVTQGEEGYKLYQYQRILIETNRLNSSLPHAIAKLLQL